MRKLLQYAIVCMLTLALFSCGGSKGGGGEEKPAAGGGSDAGNEAGGGGAGGSEAEKPAPAVSAGSSTVKGKVTLDGAAPAAIDLSGKMNADPICAKAHSKGPAMSETVVTGEGGTLGNVFVYVSKGVTGRFPRPSEVAHLNQEGCIYSPRVVGLQVGQKLEIANGDKTLHNVHSRSKDNGELNKGQPKGSKPIKAVFKKAEIPVTIKCDVHPWMVAYACVVDHPFFAVTAKDGAFELPKMPAGTYTVTAWHEVYGTSDQEVTVKDGETKDLSFAFKAK